MPTHFQLTVDAGEHSAEFRLLDAHGSQLAYRHTDFQTFTPSRRYGLFDLRHYLEVYAQGQEQAALDEIGVCIAEQVLGPDIFTPLWQGESQRTLLVLLPGAGQADNPLAAALARVPWEIAKPSAAAKTLGERNLLIRVEHAGQATPSQPIELAPEEALRVLFVFAEARGSQPLGLRQERLELLKLFEQEIYPQRRIVAHCLSHGVTRQRLIDQIQQHGGYHIVHWSGHGYQNLLELAQPGGAQDLLSGEELLQLFAEAGGFPPRLAFLSACHSGDSLPVADWDSFAAVAQGKAPARTAAAAKDLDLAQQPGFTGTALALLQGGVPTVLAMRYAVGDDYARQLALKFYHALLAHPQPKSAAAALNLARKALLHDDSGRFELCDHATPLLYGAEQPGLSLLPGRSPESNPRDPRLHAIAELSLTEHRHFVGRTWEMAGLGAGFIGSRSGEEIKPVALITGLGGMGKTALVAEALALWQTRFVWVLLYQAKPQALGFDREFLWNIHIRLTDKSDAYRARLAANSRDAIWLPPDGDFTGQRRLDAMLENLVAVFRAYSILLVLDNFETNLKPQAEAGGPLWACQDPAWEHCLQTLARQLAGSPSRVLLTSRRPLAALDGAAYVLPLGPLPPGEAALYLRSHPRLQQMACGDDAALARRLLSASRFHPLLMDRLARLAADAALRPQLVQALDTLEQRKDYAQLPALFAAAPGDSQELAYLDDALSVSLDQLLEQAGTEARQLLWLIALANEPVAQRLLESVWSGESLEQQRLRQIKALLDVLPSLPAELQAKLKNLPPEIHAALDVLPPAAPTRPPLQPLLHRLASLGLATMEPAEPQSDNPSLSCHELVRERIRAWMAGQPAQRGEWSETAVRLAYAQWLAAAFQALQHQNMSAALQAGSQALVYAVQAEAWELLGSFASAVVTGSSDPRLLESLLPHLYSAAETAPEGETRWRCLCYLADALLQDECPDAALPFFQQAAGLARAAAEAGGDGAWSAWADLGGISGNWAIALRDAGYLDAARWRQLESAEVAKQAGRPAIHVIANELEALRIDVMQGLVESAWPRIEARLEQIAVWWRQQRAGHAVPEAPDAEMLARAYLSALNVAWQADQARQDWTSAQGRLDEAQKAQRELRRLAQDIGATRFNWAVELTRLGYYGEAKAELEACLALFQGKPGWRAKVLGSLAELFGRQGDHAQAIIQQRRVLALREQWPNLADRARSHNNLALCLERRGGPADLAEAARHQLADLVYLFVSRCEQDRQTSLNNYAVRFRRAQAAGSELAVPRLAQLLADPAFQPLAHWLAQRQVGLDQLQADIDQRLEKCRSG